MRKLRKRIRDFLREEDGISTVEIILIIVVLIGLVIIFKSQLTSLVSSILSKITSKSQGICGGSMRGGTRKLSAENRRQKNTERGIVNR